MFIGITIWTIIAGAIIYLGYSKIFKVLRRESIYDGNTIFLDKNSYEKCTLPIIEINIRGKIKHLLVDSGANINILSLEGFKEIAKGGMVKQIGEGTSHGLGTKNPKEMPIMFEEFYIQGQSFEDEFQLNDSWEHLREGIKKASGNDVIGVIGCEFIKRNKWVLDLDNLVIRTN